MAQGNFSHLDALEAESIYIMREVAVECEKPVMLYSIDKDSSVMMHLAFKAFYPEKTSFPFLHIDTTWKFRKMIEFRDRVACEKSIDLLVYTNEEGVRQGINPFDHGAAYTDIMKTQALRQQGGILPALLVAAAGFLCSLAASCGVFSLVRCIYLSFGEREIFRAIRRLIRPIVSGLMLTVILALAYQARKLGLNEGMGWFPVGLMAVLFACDSYLYFGRKMSHVKLLVFSVAVSVLCCNGIALGAVAR